MSEHIYDPQGEADKLPAGSEASSTKRQKLAGVARAILGFFLIVGGLGYVVLGVILLATIDWTWTHLIMFLAAGVGLSFVGGLISNFIDSLESPKLYLMPWDRPRRFLLSYPLWTTIAFICIGGSYGFFRNGASSSTLWWIVNSAVTGMFSMPFWCLQLPWLRAFFRIPHVTMMVSIQGAGFAIAMWFVRDSLSQAAWAGLCGFTTSYLTSTRSKDAVSDLDKLKPIVADLLAAGGESTRSAAILINTAIEHHPRDAWLLYARAVVLTSDCPPNLGFSGYSPSLANRKAAIDDLDLAIDLDSTLADAWLLRARQKAFFAGEPELGLDLAFAADNVLTDFNEAIRQAPRRADFLIERGQFNEQRLQVYSNAEADFSKAIKQSGATAETLLARGRVRFYQDAFESAIEDMSHVIQLDPGSVAGDAFYFRGEARRALGLLEESASDFRLAIDARRDSLRKCGDTKSARQSDDCVFDAASRGLRSVQLELTPET